MNQLFVKFNAKKFSLIIGFSIHTAYTVPWIDPDVIRTRNLLIWSQTRYHCATGSYVYVLVIQIEFDETNLEQKM